MSSGESRQLQLRGAGRNYDWRVGYDSVDEELPNSARGYGLGDRTGLDG